MVGVRSAMFRAVLIGLSAGVLLTGCSGRSVTPQQSIKNVAAPVPERMVEVTVDEFTKKTTYAGPVTFTHEKNTHGSTAAVAANLVAEVTGKDTAYFIIVWSTSVMPPSAGYLMLSSAIDTDSKILGLGVFDRKVECNSGNCTYDEMLYIPVERRYLQDHFTSGLRIRLDGKRGNQVFEVPVADLTLFLSKVPAT